MLAVSELTMASFDPPSNGIDDQIRDKKPPAATKEESKSEGVGASVASVAVTVQSLLVEFHESFETDCPQFKYYLRGTNLSAHHQLFQHENDAFKVKKKRKGKSRFVCCFWFFGFICFTVYRPP